MEQRGLIILFASEKGGSGKSTLAVNLATALNKNVLLIDADKQRTSSKWHIRRLNNNKLKNNSIDLLTTSNLHKEALRHAKTYDAVIIDTAGRDSPELRTAMQLADIVFIPVRATQADLETLETINNNLKPNADRTVLALVSQASTHSKSTDKEDVCFFVEDLEHITLANTVIHSRKSYDYSFRQGLSVIEDTDKKASSEIKQLAKETLIYE